MSGPAGTRMGFAVDGTLLVPSGGTTDPYKLELAFAYGNGPATVTFGPQKDQKPLSIGGMITQLAAMLGIEDLGTVASLQASPPWDAIFDVAVQPRLSVTYSDHPAVALVLDLYDDGRPGIALPGGHMPSWLKIEPAFTVYSLLVGYDSASGIDVRAKVAFAPQGAPAPPALPAPGAGGAVGADPTPPPKTELVSFPFPVPAPPSNGLQVKYFGLGQRFGPTVDLSAADPMAAMFDELEATFTTNDPTELLTKLAGYYHPDRDWFAAAHVLLRGWEVRAVFNDPALYGLEITSTAATFNGLLLEILYQKLGDGLGVYYGELTLPVQYRTIQLGVVALTIPTFKIWIYTNGDFKVSVGWPIGDGSIGIQVYVFTGGGGFYFAKLRSGDQPQSGGQALLASGAAGAGAVTEYDPILEFGLGAWFGLGRSISSGPFSAELSLVLQGTFQGILAWEAADQSGGGSSISRAPDYYWFAATVSVIGTLQGAVDLAIIKLSVYVRLSVTAGIALEQGYGSTVLVSASVDVSASVKIVFFTISVGFSTTITETFTIVEGSPQASLSGPQNPAFKGMSDWAAAAAGDVAPLAAAVAADRMELLAGDAPTPVAVPAAPATPAAVGLTFLLQPSAVYDATGAGTPCGVASLAIACPPTGGGDGAATDLGTLVDALAAWLLRTYGPDGQWATVVTALGEGSAGPPDGWDAALTAFLAGEVAFTIAAADLTAAGDGQATDIALFPMFAELQVAVGDGAPVPFATTGQTYANYADVVASYFAELALTVVSAGGAAGAGAEADAAADPPPPPDGPALTRLLFDDYFLTLARQLAREQASAAAPSATVAPAVVANLGGLTSRALLGGLRLPDPATTPSAPPIDLPALTIGAAYALSGQQLGVDAAQPSCAATLSLGPDAGPLGGAIAFAGGATSVTSTMPVAPAPPAPVPAWSGPGTGSGVGAAAGAPPSDGAVPFTIVAPPPAHAQNRSVAVRTRLPWAQSGGATPFLVPLPPELIAAAAAQGPLTATITTDDTPPATVAYTPALLVSFTVHLVDRPRDGDAATSPYVPCVYRIDGTDDETRDRIGAALAAPGALDGAAIAVLYPAPTAGFASGTLDPSAPPLVAKTNLSTATEPGVAGAAEPDDAGTEPDPTAVLGPTAAPLSDPAAVLRLIWEAGVVRTEGFYLRYRDAAGHGLPDALFSSPTQPAVGGVPTGTSATITLAVTFPQTTDLQPWHDTLLTEVDPSYTGTLHVAPAGPDGPLQDLAPSFPPGCVAFTGTYDPDGLAEGADPAPPFTPAWAEHLYHLLQFQVTGAAPQTTPDFTPSLWSPAVGPTADDDAGGAPTYRQVIPAYRFAAGAAASNPYTSVGGSPILTLRLTDVYGNALDAGLHEGTFDVVYNDPLWPPSQWPGVRLSYTVTGTPRAAQLVLTAELDPTSLVGSGADQTQAALRQYATIADQLADPRTTVALTATMLPGFDGGAALKPQLAQAASQFATALASGAKDPVRMGWPVTIDPALLAQADADVLPVTVTVALSRPAELVYKDPDGRCVPGSDAVAQPVPADLDPPPGGTPRAQARAAASAGDAPVPNDVGLTAFAQAFEAVFAGFDGADGAARLAVRSDPTAPGSAAPPALWLLRDSAADGVRVTPTVGEAAFFSLAPLAVNLEGGTASVPSYDAQLQPTTSTQTFAGVDLDAWAQTFLAALDRVLTPDVATLIAAGAPSCFSELMLAKSVVAQALAAGVEPVYDTSASGVLAGDLVGARDAFEQAVLTRLSDGYAIASVVQVPAAVAVADPAPDPALATRLFGSIDGTAPTGGTPPGLTLSAAKLPLVPATSQQPSFLSFLASVDDGGAAANVTVALTWSPGFAEQPSPEPADAYGYQPSRWLRFALDDAPLTLGTVTIPIPARAFPATPVLTGQTATQSATTSGDGVGADPLAPYLRWDLGTTLVLPQALPQDMLGVDVTYNEPLTAASGLLAGDAPVPTLFEALASFTTAWPALAPYVLALAAAGDGAPVDGVALPAIAGAIWDQVQPVARAWAALRGIPDPWSDGSEPAGAAAAPPVPTTDTYMIDFQDAYAPSGAVVHVYAQAGDGTDVVWPDVDGVAPTGTPVPVTDPPGPGTGWYRLDYAYISKAGPDAPSALALTWPSLDALARQTARTGFWVTRNARLSGEDDPIPMNPNFVYRTPQVSYPDPVIPAITVPPIGPLPAGATLGATLQDALAALGAAGAAASTDRLLKLSLVHRFPVGGVPTTSPILLADQVRLVPDGETGGAPDGVTLAALCGMLDADAAAWHAYFTPPAEGATVGVALTLFADVAGARLPVLVITDLELTVGADWWPQGRG